MDLFPFPYQLPVKQNYGTHFTIEEYKLENFYLTSISSIDQKNQRIQSTLKLNRLTSYQKKNKHMKKLKNWLKKKEKRRRQKNQIYQ